MSEPTNTLQRLPELAGQSYNEKKFGFDRLLVATDFLRTRYEPSDTRYN
jgi:hypothetical protein